MRIVLFLLSLVTVSFAAFGLTNENLELIVGTGEIMVPNIDGTKSNIGIGDAASVFFCVADATTYDTYVNDSTSLYRDWARGQFDSITFPYQYYGITESTISGLKHSFSYPIIYDDYEEYCETFYIISIATYRSDAFHRTYYIARIVSHEYNDDPSWFPCNIPAIISQVESWSYIDDEPPSITCTDLCVTGGVVSATYSISEFSRLNEIVSGEETSVIVAADLARTTETNLAASVTATNSGESTFTFSFNPAEQNWTNSTLFIFGVEPPR